jgi:hypothetical protein
MSAIGLPAIPDRHRSPAPTDSRIAPSARRQLKLDWSLDGKLARLLTLEDAIDIRRRSPKIIG